jgi:hypothetical protein
MTFVRLVQARITEIAATGDDSERAGGYRDGLTEALSLMMQATVDDHQKG